MSIRAGAPLVRSCGPLVEEQASSGNRPRKANSPQGRKRQGGLEDETEVSAQGEASGGTRSARPSSQGGRHTAEGGDLQASTALMVRWLLG